MGISIATVEIHHHLIKINDIMKLIIIHKIYLKLCREKKNSSKK